MKIYLFINLKIMKKTTLFKYSFIFWAVIWFIIYFWFLYNKNTTYSSEIKTTIQDLVNENEKLWNDWRIIESEKLELEKKLQEKISEKLEIENLIQQNRKKINDLIKIIENPIKNTPQNDFEKKSDENIVTETLEQIEAKNLENFFDIDKLAFAVSMAETWNCSQWIWPKYNNCFGIKNWNTAPCEKVWVNNMCIYNTPEESFEAFKKIWVAVYGGKYPTYNDAVRWTGNDKPDNWLYIVKTYYFN